MVARIDSSTLVMSLLVVAVLETAAGMLEAVYFVQPLTLVGIVRVMEIGLLTYLATRGNQGWSVFGLKREAIGPGLKSGLIWAAGCGVVTGLGLSALSLVGINWRECFAGRLPIRPSDFLWFLSIAALVSPVAEELFFRGVIYGYLRRWGTVPAGLLSMIAFVLAHRSWSPVPVQQIAGGLVFFIAYEYTGSLLTPIIIHVLGNLALFGLTWAVMNQMV
ncbi:MAG: CPBP family intramembrane metalloprotease [Deltaproteobacteria bacterium]|nr:CPBP family intramembrane metalloprotease [Deltaproteobacteria bacterium]